MNIPELDALVKNMKVTQQMMELSETVGVFVSSAERMNELRWKM